MKSSPSLAKTQRALKNTLLHEGAAPVSTVQNLLQEQPPLTGAQRLEIYRYAILKRFDDALEDDFPACRKFIERFKAGSFEELGREYLASTPSCHFNLSRFTYRFPAHIAAKKKLLRRYPFLQDLALVEWAMVEAFFSKLGPEVDAGMISGLAPEHLAKAKVRLDPSVQLLSSDWPLGKIFHSGRAAPKNPRRQKSRILIYRGLDQLLYVETVTEAQFKLLSAFQSGRSLLQAASSLRPVDAPFAMAWFNEWTQSGVVRGLIL